MKYCKRSHAGLTLIELVVCLAIVGTLLSLLLPALLAARETASRLACYNNLKQIGLALHQYAGLNSTFPQAGATDAWTVAIAPYLGLVPLYEAYDHNRDPYSSSENSTLGSISLKIFTCPSDVEARSPRTNWSVGNYACNIEMLGASFTKCTDGASSTGLVVEITSAQELPWITGPSMVFGPQESPHRQSLHVLFVDGSVHGIPSSAIDSIMLPIGTPNSGEIIDGL